MPAVRDLHRVRRPVARALGVGARAVAADHLHAGMPAQPLGEGAGLPVREEIHRTVAVHVDQHGAVDVTASEREVIHSEHGHRAHLRVR